MRRAEGNDQITAQNPAHSGVPQTKKVIAIAAIPKHAEDLDRRNFGGLRCYPCPRAAPEDAALVYGKIDVLTKIRGLPPHVKDANPVC